MLLSVSKDAKFVSKTYKQDAADGDWSDYVLSVVNKPPSVDFGPQNSQSTLSVTSDNLISTGETVIMSDGTTVVEHTLGDVFNQTSQGSISNTTYDNISFSVGSQDNNPRGLAFSPDGTKMFIVGYNSGSVYQYSLSTPWNVNTASYDNISFSVQAQEGSPWGLVFSSDGTKMFILGLSTKRVHQYSLSTPWNVQSASYDNISFSVGAQEGAPRSLEFSQDGTKMFIVGYSSGSVYQYSLSTPWNVQTATYDNISSPVQAQENNPFDLAFSPDGTKMFIVGYNSGSVYQYSLSTPWNVNTASFNVSFSVAAQETYLSSLEFSPDGTKMFIVGYISGSVYQYSTQAFDINENIVDISSVGFTNPVKALVPKNDMLKTFVSLGDENRILLETKDIEPRLISTSSTQTVYRDDVHSDFIPVVGDTLKVYTDSNTNGLDVPLTSVLTNTVVNAWNVQTASYDNISFSVNAQDSYPYSLAFSSDGTKLFMLGYSDSVHQYSLSTPWNVQTASYDNTSFYVGSQESHSTSLAFSTDGTKMFIVGTSTKSVHQYSLSIAWNVQTASYDNTSFYVGSQESSAWSLAFSTDGTKMFIVGTITGSVYQYSLSTPWNVNTATYDNVSFSVGVQESVPMSLTFSSDGTKMFMVGNTIGRVHQYSLSTPWNVQSASYDNISFSVNAQEGNPRGLTFSTDGTKMFIVGIVSNSVYQYSLSELEVSVGYADIGETPLLKSDLIDISQTTYDNISFSVQAQEDAPYSLAFSSDGTKMFIVGTITGSVYQYSLSTPWNVQTASYDNISFSVQAQEGSPWGLEFSPDGTKMFILGYSSKRVHQYSLSTPWNVQSASYDNISSPVQAQDGAPTDLTFSNDGTKMFIVGYSSDKVHQYSLSTPWNVQTASFNVSFSVAAQEGNPFSLAFSNDGTKMFIVGYNSRNVHQYSLSTPWDVQTASYDNVSFSVNAQDDNPLGLEFSNDGTKMFIVGYNSRNVHQYSLSTPFNMKAISFSPLSDEMTSIKSMSYGQFAGVQDAISITYDKVVKSGRAIKYMHVSPLIDDLVVSTTFSMNQAV